MKDSSEFVKLFFHSPYNLDRTALKQIPVARRKSQYASYSLAIKSSMTFLRSGCLKRPDRSSRFIPMYSIMVFNILLWFPEPPSSLNASNISSVFSRGSWRLTPSLVYSMKR